MVNFLRGKRLVTLVAAILASHCALLAWGAYRHSPGYDEVGHLAAGISHWHFGRFDLYCVNPPLVRMVAALPVVACRPITDWQHWKEQPHARSEFAVGRDFIHANGAKSFWYFTLARWACIPLSVVGGMVCFCWARELYGNAAAATALVLWCSCPNILANAQMITPDTGAAALGAAALYGYWHWLRRPDWSQAFLAGLLLGLAELCKTTFIIFFLLWPLLWLLWRTLSPAQVARAWRSQAAQLVTIAVLGVYVLNLGYGFEGSLTRLGQFSFKSQSLAGSVSAEDTTRRGGNRFTGHWLGHVPVPLPAPYVQGIDVQKWDFESKKPSYLRGEVRRGGWWYYYLYALAVKVPLGTWLLLLMSLVLGLLSSDYRSAWRDELVLMLPLIVLLTFVSSQTGINKHLRYVLPVFPLAFVWASRLAGCVERKHWKTAVLAVAALLWSVASSLSVYPHSLSYFNALAGGPQHGHEHLLSSNISWGQDLLYLKRWLHKNRQARPLQLAVHAAFDPRDLGIDFGLPPIGVEPDADQQRDGTTEPALEPGWYAIDVNLLHGFPYAIPDGTGGTFSAYQGEFTYFRRFKPVAMAGYSIYIYHVTSEDVKRLP